MSEDLIRRSDAIKAMRKLGHEVVVVDKVCSLGVAHEFIDAIRDIPSADKPPKVVAHISFDEEKLREIVKEAVERFKEEYEIEPKRGEWKSVKASIYPYGYDVECSVCGHRMGSSFGYKFCPMCGARMKGADDE